MKGLEGLLSLETTKDTIAIVSFWIKCRIYGEIILNAIVLIVILYLGIRYRRHIGDFLRKIFD